MTSVTGIVTLASLFTHYSMDEIDALMMEFRDYHVAPDNQLPKFIPSQDVAVDHFWAAMAEQAITNSDSLRFETFYKTSQNTSCSSSFQC